MPLTNRKPAQATASPVYNITVDASLHRQQPSQPTTSVQQQESAETDVMLDMESRPAPQQESSKLVIISVQIVDTCSPWDYPMTL